MTNISLIPPEVWIIILENCDPQTLMNCYQVNRLFKNICRRYIRVSFTKVLCRYWERNVSRTFYIIEKYFPLHRTPDWALDWFLEEEENDRFLLTHRKITV